MISSLENTRYIPVNEWPKHHSWPPLGGLRHLIFHSKTNGFEKVIKRVGRRILIDEREFFNYINTKNVPTEYSVEEKKEEIKPEKIKCILEEANDAEMIILGCMMNSPTCRKISIEKLKWYNFSDYKHCKIFLAIISLYDNQVPIDIHSTLDLLKELSLLEEIGGASYLSMLCQRAGTKSCDKYVDFLILNRKNISKRKITKEISTSLAKKLTSHSLKTNREYDPIYDD